MGEGGLERGMKIKFLRSMGRIIAGFLRRGVSARRWSGFGGLIRVSLERGRVMNESFLSCWLPTVESRTNSKGDEKVEGKRGDA